MPSVVVNCEELFALLCILQKQKAIGRAKSLLETVPVHRLADIFVASFEISFEEQLSVLDCVDLKVRIIKATELVGRHLQVMIGLTTRILCYTPFYVPIITFISTCFILMRL